MGCIALLVVIALIVVVVVIVQKNNEEDARLAARSEAERMAAEAERQRYEAQQAQLRSQLFAANEESIRAFESMPVQIEKAEKYLDEAEDDFAEGAFAPFWTSVEKAALALATFNENVSTIERNSKTFIGLTKQYRSRAPKFAVSISSTPSLRVASKTATRMSEIVRKAQRSFEFSVIYEQRKTNQILVSGFRSLAQALEEMTWRITSAVDNLTSSVDVMSKTVGQALDKIAANVSGYRDDLAKESEGRSAREQKALEMLDNIQRRRYPSIVHGGLK
jgi:hypothetical protein